MLDLIAELLESRAVISERFDSLEQRGYGKRADKKLELSFTEALYLLEKQKIAVKKGRTKLNFEKLFKVVFNLDKRIHEKYTVYKDLRDRGYVVKTGFKFGSDFRVYDKGVSIKKGPKEAREHTKWVVYCVPEDYTCSFQELSRAVRLAHSIRAIMLWAIVDNENNVTFYEITRKTL